MKATRYDLLRVSGISMDSPDAVAKKFRRFKYTEERGAGFLLDSVRSDKIEGRFVEYREEEVSFLDPYGKSGSFVRPVFDTTSFKLQAKQGVNLVLAQCPRSKRSFFSALSEAFNDSVSVEAPSWDLLAVIQRLKAAGFGPVLTKAVLSNVTLSPSVAAKVIVFGGGDIREHLKTLIGTRRHLLSNVSLELDGNDVAARLEASHTGRLRISSEHPEEVLTSLLALLDS
jgi:hypothetical protein